MTAISLDEAIDQARQMLRAEEECPASDPEQVVAICRAILGQYPNLPEAQRLLGLGLLRTGDTAGAGRAFAGALQSDPRDAESLWELGLMAESQGELEPALAYVQAAWEIDPWRQDWRERVIALSRSIYGSDGHLQLTRAALSSIHFHAGLWERTVDSCSEVVSELGERLDVQILMAAALCREGRLGWAAAGCRDVLDRAPNAVDALLLLAEIERRQGNLAEAGWLRERAFAIDPLPNRVASLLSFAGDGSRSFFQVPDAAIDLTPEPAVVSAVVVDQEAQRAAAGRTEDRLVALEDFSNVDDEEMPDLVELPQVPDWVGETAETEAEDSAVPDEISTARVMSQAEAEIVPEPNVPELQLDAADSVSDMPEPLPQMHYDLDFDGAPPGVNVEAPDVQQPGAEPTFEPEPRDAVEPVASDDFSAAPEAANSDDTPDEVYAPWIPPAMAPSPRFSLVEPAAVDAAPETPSDPEPAEHAPSAEEPDFHSQPVPAISSEPDEPEPVVQLAAEVPSADDPASELERLRLRLRHNPDLADETIAGLESLVERFPGSAVIPAAHRLAGSIYRKQGKSAQAGLHYRLSLAAARNQSNQSRPNE